MLVYIGHGSRFYGRHPLAPGKRPYWEFQVVLAGRIGPLFPDRPATLQTHYLWIFPPEFIHGWTGDGEAMAEVAVFHFPMVPAPLVESLSKTDYHGFALKVAQVERLRELRAQAIEGFRRPDAFTHLRQEHLLLELCLLAAGSGALAANVTRDPRSLHSSRTVSRALLWYGRRLADNPSLSQVGTAVGASPAHLRRLFHQSLGCSPKVAFQRLQFQRALDEMSETRDGLDAIAARCGFGSASAFSRAFKQRMAYSPRAWRNALHGNTPVTGSRAGG